MKNVDIFSPNETELQRFVEPTGNSINDAKQLVEKHDIKVLLKQGENGSSFIDKEQVIQSNAFSNDQPIVDTTGAGDCYTAAFAVRYGETSDIKQAMDFAGRAAWLCITKFGALPSQPKREDVDAL